MKVLEILLSQPTRDKGISPKAAARIDALKTRMTAYADKICDASTAPAAKEFLKAKLKDDLATLKQAIEENSIVSEAVMKLPLTTEDFELVKEMMSHPIPAGIAPIYIQDIIEDDELNAELYALEESDPGRDVRPLIAEWFRRVMPDQMSRFTGEERTLDQRMGVLSPIHGYDPKMYKGRNEIATNNNAFGRMN